VFRVTISSGRPIHYLGPCDAVDLGPSVSPSRVGAARPGAVRIALTGAVTVALGVAGAVVAAWRAAGG